MKATILSCLLLVGPASVAAEDGDEATRGAGLWAGHCARCHNMRDPTEFEAKLWPPIVTHMKIRAGLPGADARAILAFLQGSAADADGRVRIRQVSLPSTPVEGEAAPTTSGKAVYETTCVACHGATGKGVLPGMPDLSAPDSPLVRRSDEQLLINMIEGFQSEGSPMAMPPRGGNPNLSDADMQRVLDYMKEAFAP